MNDAYLRVIKNECEKIEKSPGFGEVLIQIQNGSVTVIRPTSIIRLTCPKDALDRTTEKG